MPRPTKDDLIATLKAMGEEAPKTWTRPEIQFRIEELKTLRGEPLETKGNKTTLEPWSLELRKAARKKATLVSFCTEELGMLLTGNEVMSRMEMKAMEMIMKRCPAEGQDLVGFGKHSRESYQTIHDKIPDYGQWVMTTWKENGNEGVDPRLARLAAWLEEQSPPEGRAKVKKEPLAGGYLTKEMLRSKDENEKASSSTKTTSSPPPDTITDRLEKQMAMMADTMETLRKELAEVKGERPRKAKGRSETEDEAMTDDSFKMVHSLTGKKG